MGLRYSIIISLSSIITCSSTLYAQNKKDTVPYQYTVKAGDNLKNIAEAFGHPNSWEKIYEANADRVDTSYTIYIGQKLTIPALIVTRRDSSLVENRNRLKKRKKREPQSPAENSSQGKAGNKKLSEFREAFKKVVAQEQQTGTDQEKTSSPQRSTISINGMVLDETRSKMGIDFYNLFYRHWEPPSGASNFMITISEQPTPSRGTMITIHIDNEKVFQNRLQPKYAYTEKMARQAVVICYRTLLRQRSSSNSLSGY
ncbi:CsgE family curli-type amyloid fiber assembly protein [Fodinibius sediminis]|uniref:Curli production assembly/transport component CsgE n=1 Tax=Fodinibius sediminis TaxID=1214077 RepID=A0A521CGC3_9BACT|nr:CsgE family curli-type amyloid fiber assembly protein [Fodinibius sediminis]SMO58452.1 LysM domain-containing protein [Fodinibius sediminis]